MNLKVRTNNQIRVPEVRVIGSEGENLGIMPTSQAIRLAQEAELDLIEISPNALPPVAKIADYGKFQYAEKKKLKDTKAKVQNIEVKSIQVKIGTDDHDLAMKAKKASEWLAEGHRVKLSLYLTGRAKYLNQSFLEERMQRILKLVSEEYKIAEAPQKGPKGITMTIERAQKK